MLAVIEQSVGCVLSLFLIGLVGYILEKRGWFGVDTKLMLPKLLTLITLPPHLFHNVVKTFSRDDLIHLIYGAAVPAASIALTALVSMVMARFMKHPQGRAGIFKTSIFTSNTIYIGLPVNIALFGDEAIPYVLLYFFANTTFFWTMGNYLLSHDSDGSRQEPVWSLNTLKRILSPPFMAFVFGVFLIMSDLKLPGFILNAAGNVGSITAPLAIIFIGITMAGVKFSQIKIDRDVLMLLFGRFIVCPATIILITRFVELPTLMTRVFIIQASLPVVTAAVLLSSYYNTDKEYASVIVSLSTLLSVIVIPAMMVIMTLLL